MKFSRVAIKIAAVVLPAVLLTGCQSEAQTSNGTSEATQTAVAQSDPSQTTGDSTAITSLADQLTEQAKLSAEKFPAAVIETFKQGIETVRGSEIEETAKQVGDEAVDGELIGWDGNTFKLSELWNEGPIVLMWYRGGWCPYCNIQLRAMQQSLDKIENAGARLVVLTPELPEKAKETADANNLDLVALHDKNNQLAEQFGIMFDLPEPIVPIYRDKIKLPSFNGSDEMQLPLAATYVIDESGKITYAFLDADYTKRADPAEVVAAVKAAAAK